MCADPPALPALSPPPLPLQLYEYRHVRLPKVMKTQMPCRLLQEHEWRALGVEQASGWSQYAVHRPEPHLLMFRRPLDKGGDKGKTPGTVSKSVASHGAEGK